MVITILTDANHKLGMGHIFRQEAIAKEFKRRGHKFFFVTPKNKEAISKLKALKFKSEAYPKNIPAKILSKFLIKLLRKLGSGILLVDGVNVSADLISKIKNEGITVVNFDDYKGIEDLSISPFQTKGANKHLVGVDCMILSDNFLPNKIGGKKITDKVKGVFVTQGGSDTYGILPRIIESISEGVFSFDIHVGPAFKHTKSLKKSLKKLKSKYRLHRNVKNLKKIMEKSDLAISAAGITLFELLSLGVPTIVITAEPKEIKTARILSKHGIIKYVAFNNIKYALEELAKDKDLRIKLSKKSRKYIKGSNVRRVVDEILKLTDTSASHKIHV